MRALLLTAFVCGAANAAPLDDMRTGWAASASDQVRATLRRDAGDGSLCLDADFGGVSGYAVMRRELPVDWPANFELVARLKGRGGVNDVQLKLVDGDNVWWVNRRNLALPAALTDVRFKRRQVDFAWGPATDRTLRSTRAIEFVVAAGRDGGKTTLCVARLTLNPRAVDPATWPEPTFAARGARVDIDLHTLREFNGLALRWPAGRADYDVLASDDGRRWRLLRRIAGSGDDVLYLPETEARHLRLQRRRGSGWPTLALGAWPDFNAVLAARAATLPRGDVPRAFVGEQNYWTLVGVDGGGERSALLSEDGAIEVGRGGWSVEPAVRLDDGRVVTWASVAATQSLRDGDLPLPAVAWSHPDFALTVEAAADGPRDAPALLARYTLANRSARRQRLTLLLAARPWQVNPPQQFLSTPGGASPVRTLAWQRGALAVHGRLALLPTRAPQRVSALPFDGGLALAALLAAPALNKTLADPQRHASALLQFDLVLDPGERQVLGWTAALGTGAPVPAADQAVRPASADQAAPPGCADQAPRPGSADRAPRPDPAGLAPRFDAATAAWRRRLDHVTIAAGPDAAPLVRTLRTSLAHMLMSRDGWALRPGTRSYARTWVRDGAMMVAGLVRLGETAVAREFVDGYAPHIYTSGKVPCCVDQRGADPVAENDSHGEYLYAVAEVWRHTRDTAWLARHWPRVQAVTAYMESLRQSTRLPATPAHLFGLMPPSISHEGYSDKPAYSYWDDFWTLRGYKDAVLIALTLGHGAEATRWAAWRDEFQRELLASIGASAALHGIDVIPGAADRGDFDPTSTTIAFNPAQAVLPQPLLANTFERYWRESLARAEGRRAWRDYTPYELRNVGVYARLGQPERAHALLRFFFGDQRPAGWNQWAEVVLPAVREPRFLGDMPHAWVSSDYIRSALDLFAYERDGNLVVGAGWTAAWREHGVSVSGLSTEHGVLDLRLARTATGWTLTLPRQMSGGVVLAWPGGTLPAASHDGRTLAWTGRELQLPPPPTTVTLSER